MHNLHYVIIKATSHEEAWSEVESYIQDWGNENNWRTICGSVREDGETKSSGEGRFCPTQGEDTIESINRDLLDDIKSVNLYGQTGFEALQKMEKGEMKLSDLTTNDWWSLREYAKHKYYGSVINTDDFNLLECEYKEYKYDEFGVTHCNYGNFDEEAMKYVVFVDMHS